MRVPEERSRVRARATIDEMLALGVALRAGPEGWAASQRGDQSHAGKNSRQRADSATSRITWLRSSSSRRM